MRDDITILRGGIVIADGDPEGAGVIEQLTVNGQALLDMADFLEALGPVFYDRTERKIDVRFTLFALQTTRALALDNHLRASGNLGVADITIQLEENGETYSWTAAGAGWGAIASLELFGYSGTRGFQVTCGEFAAPELLDGSGAIGDLDGGNDDAGASFTDDWDGLSDEDDDAAVVAVADGGEDLA
ncbi:MAG TPA: hypothetical protein VK961_26870 [Chthoniobacter sp.]|nr:hypothetical protein [Chthoniobacter sp.]